MKKQLFISAAIIILSATGAVLAQTNSIRADIPFDFEVKGKVHPAGEYVIKQPPIDHGQRMVWQLGNDESSMLLLAKSGVVRERGEKLSIIFHRYGDQYFLSGFITAGYRIELPTSKAERNAQDGKGKKLARAVPRKIVVVRATVE